MMPDELPPSPYLKYAFRDQHNLVLLFGAACLSFAFASCLPLLLAAAGESLWLLAGPRLPAFRAWVDRQMSDRYLDNAEAAIAGALQELSERDARRFLTLTRGTADVGERARARLAASDLQPGLYGLLELRRTFLDYLFLAQRLRAALDPTPKVELEVQAAQLQEAFNAERELTARMTIRNAQSLLHRRISRNLGLSNIERNIEMRLEMLEKAPQYLKSRFSEPSFSQLTSEIDTALAAVGPAEALELAVDELLTSAGPNLPQPSAGFVKGAGSAPSTSW